MFERREPRVNDVVRCIVNVPDIIDIDVLTPFIGSLSGGSDLVTLASPSFHTNLAQTI